MIVFKSVGSALQDLALASRYYEKLGAKREFPRGDRSGRAAAAAVGQAGVIGSSPPWTMHLFQHQLMYY